MKSLPTKLTANSLMENIESQLKELKKIESKSYQTNGKFRFNPNYTANTALDLHKTTDVALLITIDSYLRPKEEQYNISAEENFSLTNYPAFTWQGYTYDQWKNDLQQRMQIITLHTNKKKLEEAQKLVEAELTKEDRLARLAKDLGLESSL